MRSLAFAASIAAVATLAACGGGGGETAAPRPEPTATNTPAPTPTATGTSFDVTRCLNQQVALGTSVTNLIVPDTVKLDVTKPNGFPNGRQLNDPVVDITLAVLFLDLTRHPANFLANLPLDPPGNTETLPTTFPYLGVAAGSPPMPPAGGTNFNFRTDPPSAYVSTDRMGMPAVATALISTSQKNPYNDSTPSDDTAGRFQSDIRTTLTGLTNRLADDFQRLSLNMCATPI